LLDAQVDDNDNDSSDQYNCDYFRTHGTTLAIGWSTGQPSIGDAFYPIKRTPVLRQHPHLGIKSLSMSGAFAELLPSGHGGAVVRFTP
jgi:hypothetical protein